MNNHPVKPYQTADKTKKQEVTEMFDTIAPKYDFLNHFLSMGIDHLWRRKLVRILSKDNPKNILDIATGTGDLAVAAMRTNPTHITGIDISPKMIQLAQVKIKKKHLSKTITFQVNDSEQLPFADNTFDAVIVGFGVRNFGDTKQGLSEMLRVTKPKGTIAILEFSKPKVFPVKQAFGLYSRYIIPTIGRMVSKDNSAYHYLPASVAAFPEGKEFTNIITQIGYTKVRTNRLSGGIATIYWGNKK